MVESGKPASVSVITLGVVVGLVISAGWIVGGYAVGLADAMKTVGFGLPLITFVCLATLINLVLIPICLRESEWGFFAAMIIAFLILVLTLAVGPVATLINNGWLSTSDFLVAVGGGIGWLLIQIPIIAFSLTAYRKALKKRALQPP